MIIRIRAGIFALTLSAALAPAAALLAAGTASADPPPHSNRTCASSDPHDSSGTTWYSSPQDLDNDGFSDIAVGVPNATVGGNADAGAVDIHYAVDQASAPSPQRVTRGDFTESNGRHDDAHVDDRFGAASAYFDANGDNCVDLAIGIPGAAHGRGEVLLVMGSPSGLSPTDAILLIGSHGPEHFGASIAALGDDLFIGAPERRIGGAAGAGEVIQCRVVDRQPICDNGISENSAGIPGTAEPNDHFGATLSANGRYFETGDYDGYLAVGEPDKDVGAAVNAGAVTILHYGFAQAITQDSPGVPDKAETGDHFGAAVAVQSGGLAVGAPGENVDGVKDAGMVQLFAQDDTHLATPLETITQRTTDVPGPLGAGAEFGASLVEFAGSQNGRSRPLAIGVPGARVGSAASAGAVLIGDWPGDGEFQGRLDFRSLLHQGSSGIGGTPDGGDRFGTGLSTLDKENQDPNTGQDDPADFGGSFLVISTPGEDVGSVPNAGALQVDYEAPSSGTKGLHDSAGTSAGERYGTAAYGSLNAAFSVDD